jgi:hypothetical protein
MVRRILTASVLAACTSLVAIAAQPVTFVLRNGERVSGELTYKGGTTYTLNGRDYPSDDIAMIAFIGGDPAAAELTQLPNVDNNPTEHERHVFVTRDGQVIFGKIYHISPDGSTITYDRRGGGRQDISANQLARVYVNPAGARNVYAAVLNTGPANAVATSGVMSPGAISVPANQPWTDTGITVKKGDRVSFTTNGQITIGAGPNPEFIATADGSASNTSPRTAYPVPSMAVGGLIARVDNGAPFPIGSNTQPITMPVNGRLYVGVNDDQFGDNSGAFAVTIRR